MAKLTYPPTLDLKKTRVSLIPADLGSLAVAIMLHEKPKGSGVNTMRVFSLGDASYTGPTSTLIEVLQTEVTIDKEKSVFGPKSRSTIWSEAPREGTVNDLFVKGENGGQDLRFVWDGKAYKKATAPKK